MSAGGVAGPPLYSNTSPSHPPTRNNFNSSSGEAVYPHISDLKQRALSNINCMVSIGKLFETADQAFSQAKAHIDFRRPDLAFVEYLRASEIVVVALPRHKDYTLWTHDQHGNSQRLALLQRKVGGMSEQFENIKKIIVNNNTRFGTQPSLGTGSNGSLAQTGNHGRSGSDTTMTSPVYQGKVKPSPSPKPDRLQSRPLSGGQPIPNGNTPSSPDALADRFARLRGLASSDQANNHIDSSPRTSLTISRPLGPRSMPSENNVLPERPLKLPLDTTFSAAMPQAPPPTYSPARNMETTGNIAPPRHSARSLVGTGGRASSASYAAPNGSNGSNNDGYFPPPASNGIFSTQPTHPAGVPRRKSVHMPKERSISAERLYDYLERFDILLIDFRSREDFDQGHIWARNVICIDPVTMRQGLSASELSDKLVLSPEEEQEMFYRRDQFELVVCYDASTRSEDQIARAEKEEALRLKWLQEALYEFNQDKPLQRPPILLIGGLDAWIDLLGQQALQVSTTQVRAKAGRPIQRRVLQRDQHGSSLSNPKRRVRDYNPLDADEERKWRDRAISESVPETPMMPPESQGEDGIAEEEEYPEDEQEKYPSIEDFNARFPDANQILQPTMPPQVPARPADPPPQVPHYPSRPPLSVYPQVPARPAPAAPRMSYTGVSDRAASQATPVSRSASNSMAPYIPSKYLAANLRLPRTGLYNFGSTCYMNATLQALSATTMMSIMFLDDNFKNSVQKDNWKGSRGLLPEIYSNVVRNLWNGDSSYIKPSTLRSFCGRLNATFSDPSQQQDAQEFFSFLVDCLHEDFNGMWSRSPLRPLTDAEEAKRERMPRSRVASMEWTRWCHRDSSYISNLLYGQLSSRIRCPQCGTTSTQYEAWAGLQVEIPERKEARLEDCLRAHFDEEELDDDNLWLCPKCNVMRRGRKKLTITRIPPILCITLRRFRTEKNNVQRKLHTRVRFPLQGLDMEPFFLPPPAPAERAQILKEHGPDGLKPVEGAGQQAPFIYDAYAVVQHHGQSTRSGHYTCAARDPARGCWRFFNDTQTRDFDGKGLDDDLAYMVFCERRRDNITGHERNGHT